MNFKGLPYLGIYSLLKELFSLLFHNIFRAPWTIIQMTPTVTRKILTGDLCPFRSEEWFWNPCSLHRLGGHNNPEIIHIMPGVSEERPLASGIQSDPIFKKALEIWLHKIHSWSSLKVECLLTQLYFRKLAIRKAK